MTSHAFPSLHSRARRASPLPGRLGLRYFFDVHAGSLSEWDDEGIPVNDLDDAVSHARYMLAVVLGDIDRLGGDRHAVVMIRDSSGIPIATVTGHGHEEPRLNFSARR